MPAQFDGQLIGRRKLYPTELRNVLERNYAIWQTADYDENLITEIEALRALRRTRAFLKTIQQRVQEKRGDLT